MNQLAIRIRVLVVRQTLLVARGTGHLAMAVEVVVVMEMKGHVTQVRISQVVPELMVILENVQEVIL